MTVIEHCDHCEREFSETEDTFVSDTGSEICGWCAATWFGEERTRLSEHLRGAVAENERLRHGLRAALDYLELVPDDSVDYEAALIRARDALGGQ